MSLVVDPSIEDLPVPVMVDILSRLPVKKIVHCKCVCKKWLNIVLDPYFADIQLSRSPTGFMIKEYINYEMQGILKWVEVEDELDHHNLHHDPVMSLDLNLVPTFQKSDINAVGSVDGLVCLWHKKHYNTYICNPITREYTILPKQKYSNQFSRDDIAYCFGVGSATREYKVIRIFKKSKKSKVKVYTLGTGQWRSLGHVPYQIHQCNGPFLKGHAHWTLDRKNPPDPLFAFDFDKETFELFPSPPDIAEGSMAKKLAVLNGCLCRCDSYESNLTIWVMKDYGIENSWHKQLVINCDTLDFKPWYVIQGYKDGTILMGTIGGTPVIYCPRRKTIEKTDVRGHDLTAVVYHPSFHRLQNFKNERVRLFGRSTEAP